MSTTEHNNDERMGKLAHEMEGRDLWNELFEIRDQQRERKKNAVWLVRGDDLPLQNSAQGLLKWYMHPNLKIPCINTLNIFTQEIPPGSRSGRMAYPGNMVMFIIEGTGYTTMDGEKHHWSKHDVIQIPVKPSGVVLQHFNGSDTESCKFVCAEPNTVHGFTVDRHASFEQLENAPEYKGPAR